MKTLEGLEIEGEKYIIEYLKEKGFFEDEKESKEREKVLGILNNLMIKYIGGIAKRRNIPVDKKSLARIFTFGSYRLGVNSSGADIDTLCVVPNFVSRNEFFTGFYEELSTKEYISDISKVTNTFVPLIKFKIHSIPIDLLMARLDLPSIPEDINMLDNKLLKHMDEKCILSLNGNRVTDEILNQVPNIRTFHSALRFIKYWGQARYLYGHAFGYPGGVAYALCVAKICQMFPEMGPFGIIAKFFMTFSKWNWPQPVIIKEVPDCNYNLKIWDPKTNPAHKNDKMPIITPVYPPICATRNITVSTLTMIKRDMIRCSNIFDSLLAEKISIPEAIGALCEPTDFFSRHKNYLVVAMAGDHVKEFHKFIGFAEIKLRVLAQKLEAIENIAYSYVFPKVYSLEVSTANDNFLLKKINCSPETTYSFSVIFIGIEFSSAKLPINASRKMNLKKPVQETKDLLGQYEGEEPSEILYEILPMKQSSLQCVLDLFSSPPEKRLEEGPRKRKASSEEDNRKKQ
ncbi:poly(A) polymerase [Nematocida sp. AWRm80]|nr:poly(A) polymerase [Nematocida sp. AWRm80]